MTDEVIENHWRMACAHDFFKFARFMPIGINLRTGENQALIVSTVCPYFAAEGSRFCWPHMILNVKHSELPAPLLDDAYRYVRKSVEYIAAGLCISPQLPTGEFTRPGWWQHRFN